MKLKKRKILTTALALSLSVGLVAGPTMTPKANASDVSSKLASHGSPIDLGIANDEKLIEMLKKNGKIAKNASPAEAEKVLKTYLQAKAANSGNTKDKLPKGLDANLKSATKANDNGLKNGKGNKLGQAKKNKIDSVEKENYDGEVRRDKVLVLAIDFPDYEKSSITKDETDMWYEDYTHEHFQDMIFGKDGYKGPNGENLLSMKQYYEQQSGGSYTVDGTVAGWYTADHPAAYYGGNYPDENGSDARPRELVMEALAKAGADPNVDLSEYDVWDRDDYDNDGVYNEPDGIIDHLMVIHAGVGEEAGGGSLGGDAIWSHRWNLGALRAVPGGTSNSDRFGGLLGAYDYTIEPEDGAAGVFVHEFGHDLGLPDEYDTVYSGAGEAVAYWSVMASGSWAGAIPGTEPPGMSAYAKEKLQAWHGGNWLSGTTIKADDITKQGTEILLDEAVTKGTNNDAVRVDLPDKVNVLNAPAAGDFEYFGGKGDEADHKMVANIDLTGKTSATLDFDAWYNIEQDWDFAMVQVSTDGGKTWESLSTNRTTDVIHPSGYPAIKENLPGYTGSSNGWVHESIDLSDYAGQKIQLQFRSMTDWATNLDGFFADNITVKADADVVFSDGAEGEPQFTLDGFAKHDGKYTSPHYYLLEWRSHNGVDVGLKNIRRGASLMSYDPGLVVWYVDESYDNNWTGVHPGDGFLGVVDADQHAVSWSDKAVGSTRYQLHDAAFSLDKTEKMFLDYTDLLGVTLKDNFTQRTPLFDDSADYSNPGLVDAGRNIPEYGLKFRVVGQSTDGTVGKVLIFK
ncbi:immune inhibitor A [Fredinandcohnia sp. QZ13]|uniref:immune inhibitor A domain-containing protein n=1 Tax=Fredinandcohnia sp. QZ13 TaxID=3073144 RepID=UPI0028530E35|nr:immune inhibitor A domain-containing protein [Fredinandcohnia sp. QZ13]MDR4888259.1 immune inhibitor A [Fredinandcohnia sp. QZ13]